MIRLGNKELTGKYRFSPSGRTYIVTKIYRGVNLVWSLIRSCFGNGFWVNEMPWINDDAWGNL